jgi:hypothetical protein
MGADAPTDYAPDSHARDTTGDGVPDQSFDSHSDDYAPDSHARDTTGDGVPDQSFDSHTGADVSNSDTSWSSDELTPNSLTEAETFNSETSWGQDELAPESLADASSFESGHDALGDADSAAFDESSAPAAVGDDSSDMDALDDSGH